MNKPFTLLIPETISRTAAIKIIKNSLEEHSGVLLVDVTKTRFELTRDFFLVLSKKFPKDRIVFIIPDDRSRHLAESLGFECKNSSETIIADDSVSLAKYNMTMKEYFWYELRRGANWIKNNALYWKKKDQKLLYYKKNNWHTTLIVSGLILAIALLLFIFHFAISKTIMVITPVITVRPTSANIIYRAEGFTGGLLDETRSRIALLKNISLNTEVTGKFKVQSIDPASAMNARGTIKIYNTLTTGQELRPQTRFTTADGVVFRSKDWIKIPPTRSLNGLTEIGTVDVEVEADVVDSAGNITGSRGNIPSGTDLLIPGLKFNQENIYAKAQMDFIGGEDPKVRIITKEEIAKFENTLAEQLKKRARDEVQKYLDQEKQKSGQDFAMLIADIIAIDAMNFQITSGQNIGDSADEIEMKATGTIHSTVFDRKKTIEYLTQIFRENLLKGTNKELNIQPDTLRVSNVVSRDKDNQEIKMTVEMNTATIYDFENPTNDAMRQLKVKIAGDDKQTALKKMKEDGQVQEVTMKNYPFWMSDVTGNIENIEFVIKK